MNPVDRLLAQANPVPTPPPGRVSPAQERLLASIVATPPRPRRARGVRLLLASSAVVAAGVALLFVFAGGGAGVNDEVEATRPAGVAPPDLENARLIHVVTRLYGQVYGPTYGDRLDGWLEPATGRARIVITAGDTLTLQQVVGANDRVRTWQGSLGNVGGITEDGISPRLAANLRELVHDRMPALVEGAKEGFRRDNTRVGAPTTEQGEYRGRAVTIHRIAPTLLQDGSPSGYYFKWYTDRDSGAIIAFERGPVGADGNDVVEMGEELEKLEAFAPGRAPLEELDWQDTPTCKRPPAASPRIEPAEPLPTPDASGARPTPTPMPPEPVLTPTPPSGVC